MAKDKTDKKKPGKGIKNFIIFIIILILFVGIPLLFPGSDNILQGSTQNQFWQMT
jgi:hypothetical protein